MTSLFCPLLFSDYTNSKWKSIILLKSYLRHSLIQAYPLKFNISYSYYFILGRTNTLRNLFKPRQLPSATSKQCFELTLSVLSTTSKQCFEQPTASFLVCSLIFIEYKSGILWVFGIFRYKTLTIQKPHNVSFSFIEYKTEITVWFYFESSFCPSSY